MRLRNKPSSHRSGAYEDQLAKWQQHWIDSHAIIRQVYLTPEQWNDYFDMEAHLKDRLWAKDARPIRGFHGFKIRFSLRQLRRMAVRLQCTGAAGYPTPGGGEQ